MNEKVWKIGCLYVLVSSTSIIGVANAACTPTPDCATIGYTETSCEGKFVRCPFDTSKLFCVPCDSSFKYDCSGANITGGIGTSCGGKYMSCTCSNGGTFTNGVCEEIAVAQNCTVGMIYYSDKSCSEEVDASKTAIGIVVKDNELIVSLDNQYVTWASNTSTDVSGIANLTSYATAKNDYAGKANTLAILEAYPSDTTSNNAAVYCYNYAPVGLESSKHQWYLPTIGEIEAFIKYAGEKVDDMMLNDIWSSSEYGKGSGWTVNMQTGGDGEYENKAVSHQVVCLLKII